jgi:hypothetical protein
MPTLTRPQKITLAEMRSSGVRGILIYCARLPVGHSIALSADQWPDHIRLSDLEPAFRLQRSCGKKGAARPDWQGV